MGQVALSPAFRALDMHDLRRGLRGHVTNRTLACISRTQHARSPQRVARAGDKSHSRLHFAHSTRMISAEGWLRAQGTNLTLVCISRTRHAQRVARAGDKSHSQLHFAHSTRTISAEGCARRGQIALSPAFRAHDTHDLRRGVHFRLTLFVHHRPPSAFKREFIRVGKGFSLGHLPRKFSNTHTHTFTLLASLHWLHPWTGIALTLACLPLDAFCPYTGICIRRVSVQVSVWKRKCSSVSVEMSVFKCKCGSVSV